MAKALGVSTQSVSKWENQKALPDIMLLPKIATFFEISIDTLFMGNGMAKDILPASVSEDISINHIAWDGISSRDWTGTMLPDWGVYIPNEEKLHLLDDISGKKILEIACGDGQSLVYCGKKEPKELWGLDISEVQIKKAKKLLKENIWLWYLTVSWNLCQKRSAGFFFAVTGIWILFLILLTTMVSLTAR